MGVLGEEKRVCLERKMSLQVIMIPSSISVGLFWSQAIMISSSHILSFSKVRQPFLCAKLGQLFPRSSTETYLFRLEVLCNYNDNDLYYALQ